MTTDLALFELDGREGDARLTHVLMPNMAYACGGNILSKAGRFQVGVHDWPAITCPACREAGRPALEHEIRAMQGRQAEVA